MKKLLIIYFLGVALSWLMAFNKFDKLNDGRPLTFGDIAFTSCISMFSWLSVISIGIVYITELDFWHKPITK